MFPRLLFKNKPDQLNVEIPLKSSSLELIPWIIALMVYLSTMALMGGVVTYRLIEEKSSVTTFSFSQNNSTTEEILKEDQTKIEGRTILTLTFAILSLIALSCVLTIAFVTHSGLIIHQKIIEILKLLGAQNHFIARQFQQHAFQMALKGAGIGTGFSAVTFLYLKNALQVLGADLRIGSGLMIELWLIILVLPLFLIGTVMIVARSTTLLALQHEE